jgi:small-conductance mechanosensitive channel
MVSKQWTLAELAKYGQVFGSGLVVIAAAAVIYLLAAHGLKTLQRRQYLPEPLVKTFQRIGFWVILAATCLFLMQVMGVLQSVVAAVTGVFALLAIGFVAVWSVLSNTLCSFILMIIRPYRIGDTLSFPPDDLSGRVVNFNLIFTTLETPDGALLQVPNNMLFQRPVVRRVGKWRIGLADQLYESENATGPHTPEKEATSQAA